MTPPPPWHRRLRRIPRTEQRGAAEVTELDVASAGEQSVLRLDVAVHDAVSVHELHNKG